jgi:flavin-dependent dehydrogenase
MRRVAVLGGGPAGAFAAGRLASAGLDTVLLDEKLAWEKPCGGGLTSKAYRRYPFLLSNDVPKRVVNEVRISAPRAGTACLPMREPLLMYSRFDLNQMLLDRAERAGARIEKARVLELARNGRGWRIRTPGGTLEADFCIVATGARNSLRDFGTEWTAENTIRALGYYIQTGQAHIDIQFFKDLEGYLWLFPRCGHVSAGICGKGVAAHLLRSRLEAFLDERSIGWKGAPFYSHLVPSLGGSEWQNNRVAGENWLAAGDAAGLVDPITGEGLYYAIRSGDLAAGVVLDDAVAPEDKPEAYRALLNRDFAADLAFGSAIARRFFLGSFLFGSVTTRMVQFARGSERFRAVMADLMAGSQPYGTLKPRLLDGLAPALVEMAFG